jgi:hypothetical protein
MITAPLSLLLLVCVAPLQLAATYSSKCSLHHLFEQYDVESVQDHHSRLFFCKHIIAAARTQTIASSIPLPAHQPARYEYTRTECLTTQQLLATRSAKELKEIVRLLSLADPIFSREGIDLKHVAFKRLDELTKQRNIKKEEALLQLFGITKTT